MLLTDTQYQERLARLKDLSLALPSDTEEMTAALFLSKLSQLQTLRNRVADALVEAFNNKSEAKALYEDSKLELEMQMDDLLANDENVKAQKTVELRRSLASTKCANLAMQQHNALLASIRADSYHMVVQTVHDNLKATFDSLVSQVSLFQEFFSKNI